MAKIQKADPVTRRKAMILIIFAVLIGAFFVLLIEHYRPAIEAWLTRDPEHAPQRFRLVLMALAALIALPLLGFAAYFWRFGARIVRVERFPPPGAGTVRDTRFFVGQAARRRGRLLQAIAVLFIFIALATTVLLWRMLTLLET